MNPPHIRFATYALKCAQTLILKIIPPITSLCFVLLCYVTSRHRLVFLIYSEENNVCPTMHDRVPHVDPGVLQMSGSYNFWSSTKFED
jgi:hypothetical protein